MNKTLALLAIAGFSLACSSKAAPPEPRTDDEKTAYALGLAMSRDVVSLHLTEAELELLKAGLSDGVLNRGTKVDLEEFRPKIQVMSRARNAATSAEARKIGAAYLEKAAAEEGATKLPTGAVLKTLQEGAGPAPMLGNIVHVRYKGTLVDGTVFDSTEKDPEPFRNQLGGFIPCLSQALQLMKKGSKVKVSCPADLAYGDRGLPQRVGPGETLVFELELVDVE